MNGAFLGIRFLEQELLEISCGAGAGQRRGAAGRRCHGIATRSRRRPAARWMRWWGCCGGCGVDGVVRSRIFGIFGFAGLHPCNCSDHRGSVIASEAWQSR